MVEPNIIKNENNVQPSVNIPRPVQVTPSPAPVPVIVPQNQNINQILREPQILQFFWVTIDSVNFPDLSLPYIKRDNEDYLSIKMIENAVLCKFENLNSPEAKAYGQLTSKQCFEAELNTFNEINDFHCENRYGNDRYVPGDGMVTLKNFMEYFDIIKRTCRLRDGRRLGDMNQLTQVVNQNQSYMNNISNRSNNINNNYIRNMINIPNNNITNSQNGNTVIRNNLTNVSTVNNDNGGQRVQVVANPNYREIITNPQIHPNPVVNNNQVNQNIPNSLVTYNAQNQRQNLQTMENDRPTANNTNLSKDYYIDKQTQRLIINNNNQGQDQPAMNNLNNHGHFQMQNLGAGQVASQKNYNQLQPPPQHHNYNQQIQQHQNIYNQSLGQHNSGYNQQLQHNNNYNQGHLNSYNQSHNNYNQLRNQQNYMMMSQHQQNMVVRQQNSQPLAYQQQQQQTIIAHQNMPNNQIRPTLHSQSNIPFSSNISINPHLQSSATNMLMQAHGHQRVNSPNHRINSPNQRINTASHMINSPNSRINSPSQGIHSPNQGINSPNIQLQGIQQLQNIPDQTLIPTLIPANIASASVSPNVPVVDANMSQNMNVASNISNNFINNDSRTFNYTQSSTTTTTVTTTTDVIASPSTTLEPHEFLQSLKCKVNTASFQTDAPNAITNFPSTEQGNNPNISHLNPIQTTVQLQKTQTTNQEMSISPSIPIYRQEFNIQNHDTNGINPIQNIQNTSHNLQTYSMNKSNFVNNNMYNKRNCNGNSEFLTPPITPQSNPINIQQILNPQNMLQQRQVSQTIENQNRPQNALNNKDNAPSLSESSDQSITASNEVTVSTSIDNSIKAEKTFKKVIPPNSDPKIDPEIIDLISDDDGDEPNSLLKKISDLLNINKDESIIKSKQIEDSPKNTILPVHNLNESTANINMDITNMKTLNIDICNNSNSFINVSELEQSDMNISNNMDSTRITAKQNSSKETNISVVSTEPQTTIIEIPTKKSPTILLSPIEQKINSVSNNLHILDDNSRLDTANSLDLPSNVLKNTSPVIIESSSDSSISPQVLSSSFVNEATKNLKVLDKSPIINKDRILEVLQINDYVVPFTYIKPWRLTNHNRTCSKYISCSILAKFKLIPDEIWNNEKLLKETFSTHCYADPAQIKQLKLADIDYIKMFEFDEEKTSLINLSEYFLKYKKEPVFMKILTNPTKVQNNYEVLFPMQGGMILILDNKKQSNVVIPFLEDNSYPNSMLVLESRIKTVLDNLKETYTVEKMDQAHMIKTRRFFQLMLFYFSYETPFISVNFRLVDIKRMIAKYPHLFVIKNRYTKNFPHDWNVLYKKDLEKMSENSQSNAIITSHPSSSLSSPHTPSSSGKSVASSNFKQTSTLKTSTQNAKPIKNEHTKICTISSVQSLNSNSPSYSSSIRDSLSSQEDFECLNLTLKKNKSSGIYHVNGNNNTKISYKKLTRQELNISIENFHEKNRYLIENNPKYISKNSGFIFNSLRKTFSNNDIYKREAYIGTEMINKVRKFQRSESLHCLSERQICMENFVTMDTKGSAIYDCLPYITRESIFKSSHLNFYNEIKQIKFNKKKREKQRKREEIEKQPKLEIKVKIEKKEAEVPNLMDYESSEINNSYAVQHSTSQSVPPIQPSTRTSQNVTSVQPSTSQNVPSENTNFKNEKISPPKPKPESPKSIKKTKIIKTQNKRKKSFKKRDSKSQKRENVYVSSSSSPYSDVSTDSSESSVYSPNKSSNDSKSASSSRSSSRDSNFSVSVTPKHLEKEARSKERSAEERRSKKIQHTFCDTFHSNPSKSSRRRAKRRIKSPEVAKNKKINELAKVMNTGTILSDIYSTESFNEEHFLKKYNIEKCCVLLKQIEQESMILPDCLTTSTSPTPEISNKKSYSRKQTNMKPTGNYTSPAPTEPIKKFVNKIRERSRDSISSTSTIDSNRSSSRSIKKKSKNNDVSQKRQITSKNNLAESSNLSSKQSVQSKNNVTGLSNTDKSKQSDNRKKKHNVIQKISKERGSSSSELPDLDF